MILLGDRTSPDQLLPIKGFIFDCDGVLIDSFAANRFYYNWFRGRFGLPDLTDEEALYAHTNNMFKAFARILPEGSLERAMELRAGFDYRTIMPYVTAQPGVRDLVLWLQGRGYRLAVHTSRTDTMGYVLDHTDLQGVFSPVVTATSGPKPKPDPEGVHFILEQWGLATGEVVFVGDSLVDRQTADSAGVRFWAYKDQSLGGHALVPDYPTLKRLLSRLPQPD